MGPGVAMNNQAESYALFLGLETLIAINTPNVLIIGDSLLVISQARKRIRSLDPLRGRMQYRINNLIEKFSVYNLLHVKRENNAEADRLANLAKGTLKKCGASGTKGGSPNELANLDVVNPPSKLACSLYATLQFVKFKGGCAFLVASTTGLSIIPCV